MKKIRINIIFPLVAIIFGWMVFAALSVYQKLEAFAVNYMDVATEGKGLLSSEDAKPEITNKKDIWQKQPGDNEAGQPESHADLVEANNQDPKAANPHVIVDKTDPGMKVTILDSVPQDVQHSIDSYAASHAIEPTPESDPGMKVIVLDNNPARIQRPQRPANIDAFSDPGMKVVVLDHQPDLMTDWKREQWELGNRQVMEE